MEMIVKITNVNNEILISQDNPTDKNIEDCQIFIGLLDMIAQDTRYNADERIDMTNTILTSVYNMNMTKSGKNTLEELFKHHTTPLCSVEII